MIQAKINQRDLQRLFKRSKLWSKRKKKEVKMELAYAAKNIVADAQDLVPVRTGRLKNSINERPMKAGLSYMISAPVKYAAAVEFKHKPYLYPALEHNRPLIYKKLEQIIKK